MILETMSCVEIGEPGGPEVLRLVQRPVPVPKPGEVLIRVAAAGINRPDLMQRQGLYPPPPGASDLPGLEVAGTIVETGEAVCALVNGGGYAQYVAVDARHCLPIPHGLTAVEAAALPETCFTVWHNLFERARLGAGETLLIHGGSGGIGSTAIQMASLLGARVFTTASPAKLDFCRRMGAALALDYNDPNLAETVRGETGGRGVDVILDMIGGDGINTNLKMLAPDGRLVLIAFQKGAVTEINALPILVKRLTVTGSTLRPQSPDAKARMADGLRQTVWPLLEGGRMKPHIHATFALDEAASAHRMMESGTHSGKIVLTVC